MSIEFLAAAGAAKAAPDVARQFGLVEALNHGGALSWTIFGIMVIMSVFSFYILFTKLIDQNKVMKQADAVRTHFWRANTLEEGAAKLDKNSAYRQLVDDGVSAQKQHGLLTVGATAPFIGLLGTVIGIYRALIEIGIAGQADIGKIAGPVGEALIMTAIGLMVAVPAVLAYNWLQARNKTIARSLAGFTNDVLGYITSSGRVKPAVTAASAGKPAAAPAAAVKK
jgi:biopolymer transport protein ExbB